jgi:hypothetical protein
MSPYLSWPSIIIGGCALALIVQWAYKQARALLDYGRNYDPIIDGLIPREPPRPKPEWSEFDQTLHDKIKPKREEAARLTREANRVASTPIGTSGDGKLRRVR